MVIDLGRRFGLKISPPVAARLADAAGNDQAIVAQELQKFALYIDASPQAPKELDHGAIDEVGADNAEGDFQRLADLALAGRSTSLTDELARLARRRIGGDPGRPLASAPAADAGAGASARRARRARRCRHDVTRQSLVLEGQGQGRADALEVERGRIWRRLPSAPASSNDR